MLYKLDIHVSVQPVIGPCEVSHGIDSSVQTIVTEPTVLSNSYMLPQGQYTYQLELHNSGAEFNILDVRIMNVTDYQFIYESKYTPQYPEPWYSEQNPRWPDVLKHHTHICWPGVWRIDLESPAYPWIHRTLNLGWIY